ncbi:MAG: tRNA pseudouridine(55) synthase TruB [Tractidigestivibacter sp.]|uniref:tRNA pseudouridine(55) synthase TruB n=1 Tax=Tractidigestivibacter sp. TaxID=2847320 RepID=UPI003D8CA836
MKRGESGIDALLGIDKPCGITSHDVVNHVRRAMGEKRVGHAGTLDPAASGVMVVGVGQATRLMGLMTAERKLYRAVVVFGCETDTDDGEGAPTVASPIPQRLADESVARELLASFVGEQDQVPPAYSAISVNGQRSYALARKGKAPDLAARRITVYSATLVESRYAPGALAWVCDFEVSKGTYVRALARDLGRRAGSAAHLGELRRLRSGAIAVEDCLKLDAIDSAASPDELLAHALDPARSLGLPLRQLSQEEVSWAMNGKALEAGVVSGMDGEKREPRSGERVSLVRDGSLFGVWHEDHGRLRSDVNFPRGIVGVRS